MRKQRRKTNVYDRLNTLKFMGVMAACAFTLVAFEWKSFDPITVEVNWDGGETLGPEPPIMPVPKIKKVKKVDVLAKKRKKFDPRNLVLIDNETEVLKEGPIVLDIDTLPDIIDVEPEFFEPEIIKPVEFPHVPAKFPGGDKALREFLGKEINYPNTAFDAGIQGKVYLQFVVRKNGKIDQIKIMRGIGGGCEEESVRALSNSPKWKPGLVDGKEVDSYFHLPVNFTLK